MAADAPTLVQIGRPGGEGTLTLAFDGELDTPNHAIRLVNVIGDVLGEVDVPATKTRIQVFLSNLQEPDEIYIALHT